MIIAEVIVAMVAYSALGFVFALSFAACGAAAIDEAARGAPLGFRLLIIPGSAALWPFLAIRWFQAKRRRSQA
jgi:hypothetical protein